VLYKKTAKTTCSLISPVIKPRGTSKAPKYLRFPKEIIYDINSMLPVALGKGSSIFQANKN
jgi:hypothetical protein